MSAYTVLFIYMSLTEQSTQLTAYLQLEADLGFPCQPQGGLEKHFQRHMLTNTGMYVVTATHMLCVWNYSYTCMLRKSYA